MYTRLSDNLFDSSLWSDGSYEGLATLKLWLAVLHEARTRRGRFGRLTPAKAARIAAIPLEMAATAIGRLTGPDADDSSGVADGRRLLSDPEGGPNDYIVTNWERYGREFERISKTERQRRWRQKRYAEASGDVDATVYPPSIDCLPVDGVATQEEKKRRREEEKKPSLSSDVRRPRTQKAFAETAVEVELSRLLLSLIRRRDPKHPEPNIQTWARHVDLLIRRDHRSAADVRRMIEWCQADDFWQNNILSTEKLRAQFGKLWLKSGQGRITAGNPLGVMVPLEGAQ